MNITMTKMTKKQGKTHAPPMTFLAAGVLLLGATSLLISRSQMFSCTDVSTMTKFATEPSSPTSKLSKIKTNDNNNIIAYHTYPKQFIRGVVDCIMDDACHLIYQHVAKTGGSTLERLFYSLFGNRKKSCCDDAMIERFLQNPNEYCPLKFTSYQAVHGFEQIVNKCNETFFYNSSKTHYDTTPPTLTTKATTTMLQQNTHERLIILTSIREPIARTLSYIHQTCNKILHTRSERTQLACKACTFKQDEEFWMNCTEMTTKEYSTILEIQALQTLKDYDHYWIDLSNLSDMIIVLKNALKYHPLYTKRFEAFLGAEHGGVINTEIRDRCDFSMNSEMIKGLEQSTELYRNFTRGILF